MRHRLASLLLAALACAGALADERPREGDYAAIEAIAGEPLKEVRYFRLRWFRPLDDRALILWLGREEPYLVDLRHVCHGLDRELSIGLDDFSRPGRHVLRERWSKVVLRDGRDCRVRQIRALDYDALLELDARFHPPGGVRVRNRSEEPPAPGAD